MTDFIHPETGELLATEDEWRAALIDVQERLGALYRVLHPLRKEYAERFLPATLPSRRNRSETQERVARCPRCGGKLNEQQS